MGGGGKGDDFDLVGPRFLTCIDWSNFNHQTAVTSSLVQGVYSLQRDEIEERKAQAKQWWESLDFSLAEPLLHKDDNSIYGAIFEYKNYQSIPHSPRYVIAFRGTMLKSKTWDKDLKDDIRCLFNNLNEGSRCKHAIKTVLDKYATDETVPVWLAGHSLGAGIALLAGKYMAKRRFPLETYAFNPPHSSFPLERLSNFGVVNYVFRFTQSILKGALAVVLCHRLTQQQDPELAAWTPYVYVNPSDIVCEEYVGDLKHKNCMAFCGLGKIESLAAGLSIRSMVCGKEGGEPIQHLLSAHITVNMNKPSVETDDVSKQKWYEFKKVHGLAQWWEQKTRPSCKLDKQAALGLTINSLWT